MTTVNTANGHCVHIASDNRNQNVFLSAPGRFATQNRPHRKKTDFQKNTACFFFAQPSGDFREEKMMVKK